MNVTSHLLDNLRVSFYWRNLIRSDLIADFKRWASTSDDSQVPDFILLGGSNTMDDAHDLLLYILVIQHLRDLYNTENELLTEVYYYPS